MTDPVTSLRALAVAGAAAARTVELVWVALDLRVPHVAAHGTESVREVVLVGVADADGVRGWGECSALSSPTYTSEFTAGAFDVLAGSMAPALLAGRHWADPVHPMATAAVEAGLIDLALRRSGGGLAPSMGATTDRVGRCVVVAGSGGVGEVLPRVADAVSTGASMVKLKVFPGWDPGILDAIADHWPSVAVAVDANGSIADQPHLLSSLDRHGVAYIEQPAPAGDDLVLADISAGLSVPVAVDESATTASTVRELLAGGAGTVVNIKPSRVGGLVSAMECVEVARSLGASVFVGGMLETGIGRAASLAVAAAVASIPGLSHLPTDLGPSRQYFRRDITDPVVVDDHGLLVVPHGPGMGVSPHTDRLAECCVQRTTVGGR